MGTFTKSGSATTSTISAAFNNRGTVNVQSGTLNLSGGGTDVGASYTGAGTVNFSGGTRTLDAASSIAAANATFSAGTTTVNGSYNVSGSTTVSGGTAALAGTVANLGNALNITSGTLNVGGSNATTGALTQSGGLLNGAGTLTVTGASAFSGGTQGGSGTTLAQGGAAFTSTSFGLDGGRVLQLGGASTATGTFVQINLNDTNPKTGVSEAGSGMLTIAEGATFNDQTTNSGLQYHHQQPRRRRQRRRRGGEQCRHLHQERLGRDLDDLSGVQQPRHGQRSKRDAESVGRRNRCWCELHGCRHGELQRRHADPWTRHRAFRAMRHSAAARPRSTAGSAPGR